MIENIPKTAPKYTSKDQSFKFKPSTATQSIKIRLFVQETGSKSITTKERFLTKKPNYLPLGDTSAQNTPTKRKINLLKTPIDEIFDEISRREAKKKKELEELQAKKSAENGAQAAQKKAQVSLKAKYAPKKFIDLLNHSTENRNLLKWLKSWEGKIQLPGHKNRPKKKYRYEKRAEKPINRSKKFFSTQKPTNPYKYKNPALRTKKLLETLELDTRADCELLSNKIPLISGPSGVGKTTLAKVIASHCGYQPVVLSLSSLKNVDELIKKINLLAGTFTVGSAFGGNPTCLILDEVDALFDSDYKAMKKFLGFMYKEKKKSAIDELFEGEEAGGDFGGKGRVKGEGKLELRVKRPVIVVCDNLYGRGVRLLRNRALVFQLFKDKEACVERLNQISRQEVSFLRCLR